MRKRIVSVMLITLFVLTSVVGYAAASNPPVRKATLKVFMSFPRFKPQFEQYFAKFIEKKKAENVDLTIKLEMPSAEQANQILKARLASNDAPDLFTLHALADIPTFHKAGYLTDLSDQPFVASLFDNVKEIVSYDGKVVALPLESLAWGYLYNREIFADLGLAPPETLDEMEYVVETLKAHDVTPFLLSFQESWIPQLMMALSLGGTVTSEHPDFVEKMNKGEGSYREVADVFNIIDLIMANGTKRPFEVGSAAGSADFANGKAAMWVQGAWMAESILKVNPDMQLGVAPLPVSNNVEGTLINLSVSTSVAVSPTSANQDLAFELLNYLLDETDSAALFEELKFNPVATFHDYPVFPWIDEAMTYVAQGRAYLDLQLPGAVTDETAKMLQSYYAKSVTQEEIIQALDKTWADANRLR